MKIEEKVFIILDDFLEVPQQTTDPSTSAQAECMDVEHSLPVNSGNAIPAPTSRTTQTYIKNSMQLLLNLYSYILFIFHPPLKKANLEYKLQIQYTIYWTLNSIILQSRLIPCHLQVSRLKGVFFWYQLCLDGKV